MGIGGYLLMTALMLASIFLILLVLIQRGRGGGLAGAFGGMGGQSAFGTKAGDIFTRVTIVTAAVWILLCALSVKVFSTGDQRLATDLGGAASQSTAREGAKDVLPPKGTGLGGADQKSGALPATGKSDDAEAEAKESGTDSAGETTAPAAEAAENAPAATDATEAAPASETPVAGAPATDAPADGAPADEQPADSK